MSPSFDHLNILNQAAAGGLPSIQYKMIDSFENKESFDLEDVEEELKEDQKETYFKCDNIHYLQTLTEGTFEDDTYEVKKNSGYSNTFSRAKEQEINRDSNPVIRHSMQTAKFNVTTSHGELILSKEGSNVNKYHR